MIDWGRYIRPTQAQALRAPCAAAALEAVFLEACSAVVETNGVEVIQLPPGHLVCLRDPEFRAPLGAKGTVIWHGPATHIWFPHRKGPEPEKQRTEHGWGIVAPEPKILEN